jgi:hypothetical protein
LAAKKQETIDEGLEMDDTFERKKRILIAANKDIALEAFYDEQHIP